MNAEESRSWVPATHGGIILKKRILWIGIGLMLSVGLAACGDGSGGDETVLLTGIPIDDRQSTQQEESRSTVSGGITAIPITTEAPAGEQKTEDDSREQESAAPEETQVPQENILTVTISAAGDCSLGNHQDQEYAYSFRQAYDQAEDEGYFFRNVKDIFGSDDMTIVNFEGVLTYSEERDESRTYNIKGDPEYARLLTAGSVEAVSFANNHRQDYGIQGSDDTVEALEAEGIVYAYDRNVGVYETEQGIRIGIVSVNEVAWGLGCEQLVEEGINKLQEEEVDLILVCCHWGIERENYPDENQLYLGRKFIDLGADLVIGHHPHVLQGVEEYNGKFIIYSLANFCFGANRNPADKDTMIFQQTFTFVDGVKQEDQQVRVIPCSVSSVQERNNFQPTPAEGEEAARIIKRINTYSESFGVEFAEDGALVP